MSKEIRAFNCEMRAKADEDRGQYIEGRAIVYDEYTDMGWYREIIDNGALDNADLKDVRLLVNHNTDMIPLARSRNNNDRSTMQLTVDENGMGMRANLDTENNSDARSLYSGIDRGDIDKMSFMFMVDEDRWEDVDTDYPTRHILGISKVFEVSAVTWPAYESTSLESRGLAEALDSAKASLENVKAEKREIERQKHRIKILTEVL